MSYFILQKLLNIEAEIFKVLDGSHIQVSFFAQDTTEEEDDQFNVTLIMDYRIYDIRPKTYYFREIGNYFVFLLNKLKRSFYYY